MGLCSGHGSSVVIHELSLYPQSLLAKLTVRGYIFAPDHEDITDTGHNRMPRVVSRIVAKA